MSNSFAFTRPSTSSSPARTPTSNSAPVMPPPQRQRAVLPPAPSLALPRRTVSRMMSPAADARRRGGPRSRAIARSLHRAPARIRLVAGDCLRDVRGARAQIALVDGTVVAYEEGHHARRTVLRRVRDERTTLSLACRQGPEIIAVEWDR